MKSIHLFSITHKFYCLEAYFFSLLFCVSSLFSFMLFICFRFWSMLCVVHVNSFFVWVFFCIHLNEYVVQLVVNFCFILFWSIFTIFKCKNIFLLSLKFERSWTIQRAKDEDERMLQKDLRAREKNLLYYLMLYLPARRTQSIWCEKWMATTNKCKKFKSINEINKTTTKTKRNGTWIEIREGVRKRRERERKIHRQNQFCR